MNPDLLRVLVSAVLMLSQGTTLRTTGHQLSLNMGHLPAMDVVVSVVLSQDILVMAMDLVSALMDTELVASALVLV